MHTALAALTAAHQVKGENRVEDNQGCCSPSRILGGCGEMEGDLSQAGVRGGVSRGEHKGMDRSLSLRVPTVNDERVPSTVTAAVTVTAALEQVPSIGT
jgi:hypothetical protein